ncbi:23S rRNA (pseudouridine1915-N3)-methyltransferase [Stella humosa]|uniref:Ribosomal RNA large subunit methyltransferase H n=1 Tax=Stella humosa TaxID=94 RepID=A0A3N1L0R3_9PROT|nr:23S rRNA (pseudouridine(1915)-N(3))-methyltransferase RlmH [Stella humosa]ROP84188.1 23S rRNA (pseudouridine1915-N3)-methyltransferase [Stella humosa]BBK33700.1 ribosomal RNA large subunit methyltransferase H [Stella humosa]
MRIHVIAVGRARGGPTATLFTDYAGRLPWPVTLHEVEAKAAAPAERTQREEALMAARIPARATIVALDPRGRVLSSEDLAQRIGRWRDEGTGDLAFLIGGADGLGDGLRARAHLLLSFGPMIWPHLLARAMLAEQLFRAHTILTGHPYHRE